MYLSLSEEELMRCDLLTKFLVTATLLIFFGEQCFADKKEVLRKVPESFSIKASVVGRFAKGASWHLKVSSAGKAKLVIDTYPKKVRRFVVTNQQLDDFRKAVVSERFFELADEYGDIVVDGSESTITVKSAGRAKSIKIYFLGNWARSEPNKLAEPARALRILDMVREWFEENDAV